jgi:putative ABC transport system permease protein
MRTLGASRALLRKAHLVEFALLGLISGFVAVLMSEAILFALYTYVLHLDYHINWILWMGIPLISTLCIMLTGFWGLRRVVKQSPMQVLREI